MDLGWKFTWKKQHRIFDVDYTFKKALSKRRDKLLHLQTAARLSDMAIHSFIFFIDSNLTDPVKRFSFDQLEGRLPNTRDRVSLAPIVYMNKVRKYQFLQLYCITRAKKNNKYS